MNKRAVFLTLFTAAAILFVALAHAAGLTQSQTGSNRSLLPPSGCPSGWVCPAPPILDPATTIGIWYQPWWGKPGYTPEGYSNSDISWEQATRYKPTYGYYWAGDPDNIDYEFAQLKDLGVDYVILDNTNLAIIADKGNIEKNIQAIFKRVSQYPADKQIPLTLAIGGELWAARSVDLMNNAADFVYKTYATQPVYYKLDGKPLLIDYNDYITDSPTAPDWTDPRFTVRYATGIISQSDQGILASQKNYPGIAQYGWWGWISEYPQFITAENVLVTPGADFAHRAVTAPASCGGSCTYHFDREGGYTFIKEWLAAIKAHPKNIVVTSWNDFSDETGIEPARPATATAPPWVDYYGEEMPDWYVQIAKGYMSLRTGLVPGGYYRDEDADAAYNVANGRLVYQGALTHRHPVIVLPAGTLKSLLSQQ
jgi:hypothetical protein